MLHHWVIAAAKSAYAREDLLPRIQRHVWPRLVFHPEGVCLHQTSERTVALGAWAGTGALGLDAPVHLAEDEVLFAGGFPTLESVDTRDGEPPAASLARLSREQSPSTLYESLGGSWNLGHLRGESVRAVAAFAGYHTCFFVDSEDFFAVGNNPTLLASFANRGGRLEWDPRVLSWLLSTTMILGHEVPLTGVHKLPPGVALAYDPQAGLRVTELEDRSAGVSAADAAELIDSGIERLQRRAASYLDRGMPVRTHITGGKDTRAVLALLAATGLTDRVERFVTNGSENSGDVLVARQLASEVGVSASHRVRTPQQALPDLDRLHARFLFSSARYGGQLTPYDGPGAPASTPHNTAWLGGGGGEIYRQKKRPPTQDREALVRFYANWTFAYDALGLLAPPLRHWQTEQIERFVEAQCAGGAPNPEPGFYIDNRLSNWGCGHLQQSPSPQLPLLLDLHLYRAARSIRDAGEDIHYRIVSRCAPALLKVPFYQQRWHGTTRNLAARDRANVAPLEVPHQRSFAWQYAYYHSFRRPLVEWILDHRSSVDGVAHVARLEALGSERVRRIDTAHIKMLLGLVTLVLLGEERPFRMSDFPGVWGVPQRLGNRAARIELPANENRFPGRDDLRDIFGPIYASKRKLALPSERLLPLRRAKHRLATWWRKRRPPRGHRGGL